MRHESLNYLNSSVTSLGLVSANITSNTKIIILESAQLRQSCAWFVTLLLTIYCEAMTSRKNFFLEVSWSKHLLKLLTSFSAFKLLSLLLLFFWNCCNRLWIPFWVAQACKVFAWVNSSEPYKSAVVLFEAHLKLTLITSAMKKKNKVEFRRQNGFSCLQ